MTRYETDELLSRIKAAWPTFRINEFSAVEWQHSLGKYPMSAINTAFEQLKNTCRYAPSIADFFGALEAQGITKSRKIDGGKLTYFDGRVPFYIREKGGWQYAGLDSPENLIEFEGRKIRHVEYICEVLGDKRANEFFRDFTDGHGITGVRSLSNALKNSKFPAAEYKQFILDCMELANQEAQSRASADS